MAAFESSKIVPLVLRIVTFALLLISLIVLVTVSATLGYEKYSFTYFKAFRYLIAVIVIGIVYTLMQIALFIFHLKTKADGLLLLNFYGDKIITFLLATAVGAGLGASIDLKELIDPNDLQLSTYFGKIDASASLVLLATICTGVSSVFSSYALPKPL